MDKIAKIEDSMVEEDWYVVRRIQDQYAEHTECACENPDFVVKVLDNYINCGELYLEGSVKDKFGMATFKCKLTICDSKYFCAVDVRGAKYDESYAYFHIEQTCSPYAYAVTQIVGFVADAFGYPG